MAQLIKTSGALVAQTPKNGKYFTLDELQNMVGGVLQTMWFDDGRIMVINQDAKSLGLPENGTATHLARLMAGLPQSKYIAGDAVVGRPSEIHLDC